MQMRKSRDSRRRWVGGLFVVCCAAFVTLVCGCEAVERVEAPDVGATAQHLVVPVEHAVDSAADATLYAALPYGNEGSETFLRTSGAGWSSWETTLLRFGDQDILDRVGSGKLVNATIELTVESSSGLWNSSLLGAYKMIMPWEESGATWVCANDTDFGFFGLWVNNCAWEDRWGMETWNLDPLPHEVLPSGVTIVQDGVGAKVRIDVTADVEAFLAGGSNHGWMIAPVNELLGRWIAFESREGANPPQLLLTVVDDECPDDPDVAVAGDCGCPSSPVAAGTGCNDGLCGANAACDGAGTCGDPNDCAPEGGDCTFHTYPGMRASGYWHCTDKRDWVSARLACAGVEGTLLRPDDAAEDAFGRSLLTEAAWLDGSDLEGEDTWRYSDGTQLWPTDPSDERYVAWAYGQPDDAGELEGSADCNSYAFGLNPDDPSLAAWADDSCVAYRDYICELPADQCPDNPRLLPGEGGCDAPEPQPDMYPLARAKARGLCETRYGDGKEFLMCSLGATWEVARRYCAEEGMELAGMISVESQSTVSDWPPPGAWIGGSKAAGTSVWSWQDSTVFWDGGPDDGEQAGVYASWEEEQPEPSPEAQCLRSSVSSGQWFPDDCARLQPFICSKAVAVIPSVRCDADANRQCVSFAGFEYCGQRSAQLGGAMLPPPCAPDGSCPDGGSCTSIAGWDVCHIPCAGQ